MRCIANERRLPVELKIVLAFQDVVKQSKTAAQTSLTGAGTVPGDAEPRAKFVLTGSSCPMELRGLLEIPFPQAR
jgi:hypothetical protein